MCRSTLGQILFGIFLKGGLAARPTEIICFALILCLESGRAFHNGHPAHRVNMLIAPMYVMFMVLMMFVHFIFLLN
jgi:hypothetical protein